MRMYSAECLCVWQDAAKTHAICSEASVTLPLTGWTFPVLCGVSDNGKETQREIFFM
jgi:hypothetical protein